MAKSNFQQLLHRRERLLGLLRAQEFWTSLQLCEQLDISQRTLMRDIASLREDGYPINADRGRGGGISLYGRWGVEKLHLNHREVIEMLMALTVMEQLQSPLLTNNLKQVKQKISSLLPPPQRRHISQLRKRIMIGDAASNDVMQQYALPSKRIAEHLLESFFECRQIKIHYKDEQQRVTERVIEAHYILFNWPVWYVLAWDELRHSIRWFRLDRIGQCQPLDSVFRLRKQDDFAVLYRDWFKPL